MNSTDTSVPATETALAVRLGEPGVVLRVGQAGHPTAQAHTGLASLELAAPIGENTAFNIGSVAKQITAYLCIRAARDRLLTLDRPVGDILPRFDIPDVTVGDLMQHRGGIRDAESLLSLAGFRELDHYTAGDLLQLAYRQRHRAVEPGHFLYSNTGYLLLAEVLTHAYGAGLHEIADRYVFTPLGMTSARFKADPREVIPGAAASYQAVASGWQHQQRPVTLPGPGSLWCTAADLDRWLAHLWHEWRPSVDNVLPFDQHLGYQPSDHAPFTYGAGLYADPRLGRTAVFHYGHEQGSPPPPTSPTQGSALSASQITPESPPTTCSPRPSPTPPMNPALIWANCCLARWEAFLRPRPPPPRAAPTPKRLTRRSAPMSATRFPAPYA